MSIKTITTLPVQIEYFKKNTWSVHVGEVLVGEIYFVPDKGWKASENDLFDTLQEAVNQCLMEKGYLDWPVDEDEE